MMKLRGQDGPEYEVVSVPIETSSSLGKTADEISPYPPSHLPLPTIPLPEDPPTGGDVGVAKKGEEEGVAEEREEEGMYDKIPGDQ